MSTATATSSRRCNGCNEPLALYSGNGRPCDFCEGCIEERKRAQSQKSSAKHNDKRAAELNPRSVDLRDPTATQALGVECSHPASSKRTRVTDDEAGVWGNWDEISENWQKANCWRPSEATSEGGLPQLDSAGRRAASANWVFGQMKQVSDRRRRAPGSRPAELSDLGSWHLEDDDQIGSPLQHPWIAQELRRLRFEDGHSPAEILEMLDRCNDEEDKLAAQLRDGTDALAEVERRSRGEKVKKTKSKYVHHPKWAGELALAEAEEQHRHAIKQLDPARAALIPKRDLKALRKRGPEAGDEIIREHPPTRKRTKVAA